jgi:hypothetical protein
MFKTSDKSSSLKGAKPLALFDPKNKNAFIMYIVGRRNKGKSTLLIKMLLSNKLLKNKFHEVYLINPTYEEDEKYHVVNFTQVFTDYNPEIVMDIKQKCIEDLKNNPNKQTLIIFDDCIANKEFKKDNENDILNEIAFNSRHFNISTIILSQYYKGMSLMSRTQIDYLIFFNNKNKREKDALYDEWGEGTKNDFIRFLEKKFTGVYDFLLFDNKQDKIYKNFILINKDERL